MKIIQRYYLKEFFRLYLIIIMGFGLLSSLIEVVEKMDNFIPNGASVKDLLYFAALNVPRYLLYIMPVVALISGLFVFGQAGRRKETMAIKAAGGSIRSLLMPFLYLGLFLTITAFLMNESVVPDFSKKANKLRSSFTKNKREIYAFKEGSAWLRAKDHIVKIDLYLPESAIINGISIMKMEDDMLTERIEAESAEWKPVLAAEDGTKLKSGAGRGIWYLKGITRYDIRTGTAIKYKELQTDIIDPPDILGEDMQGTEEMNVRELFSYTKKLKESGIKNTMLTVDTHSRLSYPLINIIMLVLGISLACRSELKISLVITIGILISTLYWFGYVASLSLGYTGIVPPVLAPWLVPAIFGGIAAYLYIKTPE